MSKEILHLQEVNPRIELAPKTDAIFTVDKLLISDVTGNHLYLGWLPDQNQLRVAKFSVFPDGSKREWKGYLRASSQQIATAVPIALVSRMQQPSVGLVTSYIDGPSLAEVHTETDLYQLGTELRKLHTIALPGYGYFSENTPQFQTPWEYLSFWFDKTLRYVEDNPSIYALFKQLHDCASSRIYSFSSSFIHRDVRLENVFADAEGIKFIDFEWWQGGDPMDDVAISLYHWLITNKHLDSFKLLIAGYYQEGHMTDKERTGIGFYLLLQALRFVSFCERNNPKHNAEAYQNLNKVILYINSEHLQRF